MSMFAKAFKSKKQADWHARVLKDRGYTGVTVKQHFTTRDFPHSSHGGSQSRIRDYYVEYETKPNPARKSISLKNFTGKVTRLKGGTVSIKGRGKRK